MIPKLRLKKLLVFILIVQLIVVVILTAVNFIPNLLQQVENAKASSDFYVSISGSDSNTGSQNSPYRTISKAINSASAGTTIHIFSGTYNEKLNISKNGSTGLPITIKAVSGNTPVLYNDNSSDPVVDISGDYIVFEDIEVKQGLNGAPLDCVVTKGNDVTLRNLKVHDCWHFGIRLGGQNGVVENSLIYNNQTENKSRNATSWGSGIKIGQGASNSIIRNNKVYNNWGEGIALTMSGSALIEDNDVYDNFSVNIYIDNSFDVDVFRNFTYSTNPDFYRNISGSYRPANCISMGEENYSGWTNRLKNIRIINNIMYHCRTGTGYTYAESTSGGMDTVTIAYNTVWDSTEYGIRIIKPSSTTKTQNSVVVGNIFDKTNVIEPTSGVSFSNNLWVTNQPSQASGNGNIIGNPEFIDIPTTTPESYRLKNTSPAIDAGATLTGITTDFEGKTRGLLNDIGAIEYSNSIKPPEIPPQQRTTTNTLLPITTDAYVNSNSPSLNYGQSTLLKASPSPIKYSYLRLDLRSLLGKDVKKGYLKLYVTDSAKDLYHSIYLSSSENWLENSITYKNKPSLNSKIIGFTGRSAGNWITVDLTTFISQHAGEKITIIIRSKNRDSIGFCSSEGSCGRPYLSVEYYNN